MRFTGGTVEWWCKGFGWCNSRIISVSTLGYPTVLHPVTGKRKQLRFPSAIQVR